MYVNYGIVKVGDKFAIEDGRSVATYQFCTVTRQTVSQIEVTLDGQPDKKIKFSKTTGKMLGGESWDKHKQLVTAVSAQSAIARQKGRDDALAERSSIRKGLADVAQEFWDASTLEKLDELRARIGKWIA